MSSFWSMSRPRSGADVLDAAATSIPFCLSCIQGSAFGCKCLKREQEKTYSIKHTPNISVESIALPIPILDLQPAFLCFQWWCDVCIHPEGPECVVEVEDHHLGER